MSRFAIPATLSIAVLFFSGCKSQQQVQKESADQLTAKMLDVQAQYRMTCDTPSDVVNKAIMRDAMGNGTPAEHKAHADQAKAEESARHASPECQALEAQSEALGKRINEAMNIHSAK